MNFLWIAYEVASRLSFRTKVKILIGLVLTVLWGYPTSEWGWIWRWTRQSIELQNCANESTQSILDAMRVAGADAQSSAISMSGERNTSACGDRTLRSTKSSITFLLDEHHRRSENTGMPFR